MEPRFLPDNDPHARRTSSTAAACLPRHAQAQPSAAADALARSPRMTAQRQAMRAAFGPVAQRTSLNGVLVDEDVPYPNDNQEAVLTHMAGEWDGAAGHAVTGGHLQEAMVAAWGPAVANSVPGNASAAGVHFAGGLPGNNITPHQHTFRLARRNPGNNQTAVSLPKQSTFWPGNWDNDALIGTLGSSFRNGGANIWASNANMTYWYRWQTLGANTLFPMEKVATATGTLRNRMKAGRP